MKNNTPKLAEAKKLIEKIKNKELDWQKEIVWILPPCNYKRVEGIVGEGIEAGYYSGQAMRLGDLLEKHIQKLLKQQSLLSYEKGREEQRKEDWQLVNEVDACDHRATDDCDAECRMFIRIKNQFINPSPDDNR